MLDGRRALVTGGANGIGRAIAVALAREGAAVVVADLDLAAAEALIPELGPRALAVRCDVAEDADLRGAVAAAVEHLGGLDLAVNNAGIEHPVAAVGNIERETFERVTSVNLTGLWASMKYELAAMKGSGGAIVNIASAGGLVGVPGVGAYVASKHGVVGLTRTAAVEYATANIRVNAVCPGYVRTAMVERLMEADARLEPRIQQQQPMGRLGLPEEVAEAVAWLGSSRASFVTGVALPVDGGLTTY